MKSHVRVAVIGGGVVGASVLYHLTKLGWQDVVLLERSELTSGSTWHAAGGFHTLNADTNMAALQGYTIGLYRELEQISGQSCGLHHVGGVTLATTPERMDYLKAEHAKHQYMGLKTELVGPAEIRQLSPITNTDGVLGGLYDPLDGHLDPYGTTHAYANAAKKQGAEVYLYTHVSALKPRADGSWEVVTDKGILIAEHVVNAAGLWAREVGRMVGVELPLHPMEHQYLVTDDLPEVYNHGSELPHVMDPAGESYLRQEGRGLVIGFYEQRCDPWGVGTTRWDFGHELLENQLDRISESLEIACQRYPVLARAGIKTVINGPFTFAPDGNPLVGPVGGLRNYWSACAVMAGFSQGGGVGLTLAEWMVEGEPGRDVFAMDVARFGTFATRAYTRNKVKENYQKRFSISFPNEERPAGRPLHTTPMYSVWEQQGAVFGVGFGLEHVNYFARPGEPRYETPTFLRSNAFSTVAEECRAVRTAVGINEIHNFSKFTVKGAGARAWLDSIMAGRIPAPGRLALSPLLSPKGKIIGDFTISCLAEDSFQLTASYGAQAYHQRWFEQHLPESGVELRNVSLQRVGFQIAGPKARDLLASISSINLETAAFPFMAVREGEVGLCDALVQRVSYTGDQGYEIYVDSSQQLALYRALVGAGEAFGLRPFGMRAMMSLRLEKGFGSWLREYKPDYTPLETGLSRFVAYDKPVDFIGKAAALAERAAGVKRKLATLVVETDDADVHGDEPIWANGELVGFVTSGGYAHWAQQSVAIGFLPPDLIVDGTAVFVELLGQKRPARVITKALFDADLTYLRS